MLSEEEKQHILERIQLEQEIRQTLTPKQPPTSAAKPFWETLNSSFVLLVLTSLVTAIIVPYFQRNQSEIEWKRQIRADNIKYRLSMMRQCQQEFVVAATFTSEAHEIAQSALDPPVLTDMEYRRLRQALADSRKNRFKQNAKVLGLVIHFPDHAGVDNAIFAYTSVATDYITNAADYIDLKYRCSRPVKNKSAADADRKRLAGLQDAVENLERTKSAYDMCLSRLNHDILEEETRYEKFTF